MDNKYEFKNYRAKIKDLNKYLLINKKDDLFITALYMNIKCKDGKTRKYKRWVNKRLLDFSTLHYQIMPKKFIYGTSIFELPCINSSDVGKVIKFTGDKNDFTYDRR